MAKWSLWQIGTQYTNRYSASSRYKLTGLTKQYPRWCPLTLSSAVETVEIIKELIEIWPNKVCDIRYTQAQRYCPLKQITGKILGWDLRWGKRKSMREWKSL